MSEDSVCVDIDAANSGKTASSLVVGRPFQPGQSGNPKGRPKRTPEEMELISACKGKSPAALEVMENLMYAAKSEQVRLQAGIAILDRAYGKPTQSHKLMNKDGSALDIASNVIIYLPDNGRQNNELQIPRGSND